MTYFAITITNIVNMQFHTLLSFNTLDLVNTDRQFFANLGSFAVSTTVEIGYFAP